MLTPGLNRWGQTLLHFGTMDLVGTRTIYERPFAQLLYMECDLKLREGLPSRSWPRRRLISIDGPSEPPIAVRIDPEYLGAQGLCDPVESMLLEQQIEGPLRKGPAAASGRGAIPKTPRKMSNQHHGFY